MKTKVTFILFLILSSLSVYAQNGEPNTLPINWNDTSIFISKQTEFYLGWHWAGPRKEVNDLLHINHYHNHWGYVGTRNIALPNIPNDGKKKAMVWRLPNNNAIYNYFPAVQIDPTAPVHPLINHDNQGIATLHPRIGDTTGAIYGFSYRDTSEFGQLPDYGNANFDRYVLSNTGVPDTGVIVLDEPSAQSLLGYSVSETGSGPIKTDTGIITTTGVERNGSQWYLSVNLRRTDVTDTIQDDSIVLVVRIPYQTINDSIATPEISGYCLFDRVPVSADSVGNVDTLPFGRGRCLKLQPTPSASDSTELVITRRMLPRGDATDPDITTSAFFRLNTPQDSSSFNPFLQILGDKYGDIPSNYLVRAGITVRYYGRSSVGIDWFRFETPFAQLLFRSRLDTSYIADAIYHDIQALQDDTSHTNLRILSFYGQDDLGTIPCLSLGERYISSLLSGHWISYVYGAGQRYDIIQPAYRWIPQVPCATRSSWGIQPISPYRFRGDTSNYCNIPSEWGPSIHSDIGLVFDSLTASTYESSLYGNCVSLRDSTAFWNAFGEYPDPAQWWKWSYRGFSLKYSDTNDYNWKGWYKYPDYLIHGATNGPLACYESEWYQTYKTDSTLIFSDQPWWTNIWIGSNWECGKYSNGTPYIRNEYSMRPATGEEIRLQMWGALIHGCTGFMFERMYHYPSIQESSTLSAGQHAGALLLGAMNSMDDKNTISDSMLHHWGARIFDSTMIETGGDFIVPNDSLNMDQYLDTAKMRDSMGLRHDRFYVGRLSTRHEVKRMCDLIGGNNGIGDSLMSLRLMATWYKGYEETSIGDTVAFKRLINLDTTQLRTRPIGRSTYEDTDSSFINVTLLADTTVILNNRFILGVLNPRTAPFVWLPDTDSLAINRPDLVRHSSHPGKVLTFLTTMEFENYVMLGKLDKYAQSGAREITIPFNYHDTLGRYAMLHVKELGGGIDTIIGQDSPLAVKFLPGEGKMFNVTILHPDAGVAGRLQYSNQRKMVGYPILRPDGTPSDSVYYHLTYHRYDPIAARNSVYYRRSNPVWYNSSSENVTWQSEKLLGEHIRVNKCSGDTIMRFSCAYPSLVVRYDESDSSNKVYVVYSCMVPAYDSCNAAVKRVIVENVFKAESTVDDTARYFDTYIGELSEYGTPMVNASSGGNYYCWSDSTKGIVVGWKPPNARELTDFRPLSWAAGNSSTTLGCKHPSMNSYSRISLGEADCALVWEEKINTPILHFGTLQRTHIFYTRLKMIGDTTIHHFLSPSFFSTGESVSTSSDGSIARMSTGAWAPNAHRLPSVYRDLVDSVVSGSSIGKQRDARTDCLVWSAQEYSIIANPPLYAMANLNDIIYRRTAWINDTSSVPTTWGVGGLCRIWNSGSFLENSSISQGISKVYNTGLFSINESDSAVLIHINDYTTTLSGTVNKLWHIRGNINYLYSGQDTSVSGYYNDGLAKIVNTNGEYGQTAAFPVVSGTYSWRKNRRIYQTDTASPRLEMSPRYFLKASDNDEQIGFTGFSGEESKYMLSNPFLNGTMLKFNRVRQDQLSNEKRVRYYDRVSTDWFTVGDTESLWLKSVGKNSELVLAFVERRSDGARFPVELGVSDDTTALWTPIHLRRGGTEEYRFFILKRLTDENNRAIIESSYGEEMVLHGIKTAISSQKMGANGIQEIDLGRDVNVGASIRVYPNPAREKVTVVVTDTNQKNTWHVKVMNVLGTILSENDSKPNTSIEIVTEDYPTGIYYITAESGKLNATARFVIMK